MNVTICIKSTTTYSNKKRMCYVFAKHILLRFVSSHQLHNETINHFIKSSLFERSHSIFYIFFTTNQTIKKRLRYRF